jgi:2-polyprenyl-3-methyl-5-hydroxy-6-metoxy-1,4-benzoquinol methylase
MFPPDHQQGVRQENDLPVTAGATARNKPGGKTARDRESRHGTPKVLAAIASYGTSQDHYLKKVLAEYRKLRMPAKVVVLSNVMKPVQGAEVIAGLPSRNPYSLPFAHRKVFAERANDYDLFIYSEDDTLITEKHIEAFLKAQAKLEENEIAGFIRSEVSPEGATYITSIHHHFRWLPDSVVNRGGDLFAQYSNQHSGCFIITRKQLLKAISSGRFLIPPHSEFYGMLESAASDIYTQCGLRRLICLSQIKDFVVPHLANKYYSRMGVSIDVLRTQVGALSGIHQNGGWTGSLFEPQSSALEFRCSKDLYEKPDKDLLSAVPASSKRILSVGAGWGENEAWLTGSGHQVWAIPVDAIFGALVRERGIRTVDGPFENAVERLNDQRFDTVLLPDVLHLVANPTMWLKKLCSLLEPDGQIVASVANTGDLVTRLKDWRNGKLKAWANSGESRCLQPVNVRRLRHWCRLAGLKVVQVLPIVEGKRRAVRRWGLKALEPSLASRFILIARVRGHAT